MVDHVLCFMTNGKNAVGAALDGNNRRLVDDDALPRDGYECIGGAKVDSHVVRRRRGGVLYEIKGVSLELAREALTRAAHKLPVKTVIVVREGF